MSDVQKKLFKLLLEIKKICEDNKIDYYLCENLLLDALKNEEITGTYHDFSIMIKADDVNEFINAVSKCENREIEGLINNKKFPGTYLRYVASDTLYFPIYRYGIYKKSGFGINIKILKNVPKNRIKSKLYTAMEAGIEILNNTIKMTPKRIICLCFVKTIGIMGGKNRAKFIFNSLNSVTAKNGRQKYMYYKPTLGKRVKYSRDIFVQNKTVKLNGKKFNIPADERFITINIGSVNKKVPTPTFGATYIIDENIPYAKFLEECKKRKFPKSFYRKIKRLLKKDLKVKPYRSYVHKCWDLLYRTRDRFELWEKYMPQKSQIIDLYSRSQYEELGKILEEYLVSLELYASKGLGIVFDPVVFEITMELLIYRNQKDLARKYIKFAPKEHLIPLKDDLEMI